MGRSPRRVARALRQSRLSRRWNHAPTDGMAALLEMADDIREGHRLAKEDGGSAPASAGPSDGNA